MSKARNCSEEGFAHVLLLIAVVVVAGFVGSTNITTTKEFSGSSISQNVLGDNKEVEKVEEKAQEEAKKVEEQQKEAQKSQEEFSKKREEQKNEDSKSDRSSSPDSAKTKIETVSLTGVRSKTQTEGSKSETEIETSDGQKIKTKVEDDGVTKVELEHGKLKIKYVLENGVLKLKAVSEQDQEVELDDRELNEVEEEIGDGLEKAGIKIATESGKPILIKNNMAALTDFPLAVDVGTNQLIVTTPAGQKIVAVLPDQAIQNLLSTNIINKIEQVSDASITSDLANLSGVVKLEMRDDEVVYKVRGSKNHKMLGFIPVDTATTVFVSADTGQPVAQEQTVLANIVDLLSP